jgi:hypothetical protein
LLTKTLLLSSGSHIGMLVLNETLESKDSRVLDWLMIGIA